MKHPELEPEVMDAAKERLAKMGLTHYEQNFPIYDTFEKPTKGLGHMLLEANDTVTAGSAISPEVTESWVQRIADMELGTITAGNAISPEQATTALVRVKARRKDAGVPRPPKKPADAPAVAESSIGARLADLLESRDQAREKWLVWKQLAQEKLAIYTALDAELRAAIDSLRGGGK